MRSRKKEILLARRRTVLITSVLGALVLGAAAGYGIAFSQYKPKPNPITANTNTVVTSYPAPVVDDLPDTAPVLPTPTPSGPVAHILEYHYVRTGIDQKTDPIGYNLSVSPTQLDSEIAAMKAAGYSSETMADYVEGSGNDKTVVMTFDDGYEDFYTSAYPILKKYNWTATIYIISGKIGDRYMTWDQLRELKANGIEIGAHTVNHINLATATPARQHYEIFTSKATIQSEMGGQIASFCYPSGKYSALTESLVKQAGFTSATTEHPGGITHADDPFQFNRVRVGPNTSNALLLKRLKS